MVDAAHQGDEARWSGDETKGLALDEESLRIWNTHFAVSVDPDNPQEPIRHFPNTGYWRYLREFDHLWLKYRFTLWPKSRRLFITWRTIGNYLWDTITHRTRYTFLQSRELSDAGMVGDHALGTRCLFMLEQLPKCVRPKKQLRVKESIVWVWPTDYDERATIRAVSADFDTFRSYPSTGAFLDEVAMQQHPELAITAARHGIEKVGRLTGVSTSNGQDYFYRAVENLA